MYYAYVECSIIYIVSMWSIVLLEFFIYFLFFERKKEKRNEGVEERGRKRGTENGNVALF